MTEVLRAALEYVQARVQTALVEIAAGDVSAALEEVDRATARLDAALAEIRREAA